MLVGITRCNSDFQRISECNVSVDRALGNDEIDNAVVGLEFSGRRTFFPEILGILQIIPNIIPNLGILGRVPSEPSMLGGVPNADRNIPFRAFIQCSVGARTDTIIK